MELIRKIGAETLRIKDYAFLSFNKQAVETTAYYVHDSNQRQGIGLSLFTAGNIVTVNVTSYNLFYNNDLSFDEALVSGYGGLVEEERQACMELLRQACERIPKQYTIQYSSNVTLYVFGGKDHV